jgi:hypothetical protein
MYLFDGHIGVDDKFKESFLDLIGNFGVLFVVGFVCEIFLSGGECFEFTTIELHLWLRGRKRKNA